MSPGGQAPIPVGDGPVVECFTARFAPDGPAFSAPADRPLLDAAARAGIALPSSCRNGTCRTCMCRLLEGQVRYVIQWPGLLPEEKAKGWILPCIARAQSDVVLSWPYRR